MTTLLLAILLVLATPSHGQDTPASPCPDTFTYEMLSGSVTDRWYGIFRFPAEIKRWSFLNVVLDKKAELFGTEAGDVITSDNKDFQINNNNRDNPNRGPGQIKFFVKHGLEMAPKIHLIRVDDQEVCNAEKFMTRVSLPATSVYQPTPPQPSETQPDAPDSKEHQCGTVKLNNPIPLVVEGIPTNEGQWPWQVALYRTEMVNQNYICGGTLVSHKHIITAAHCTTVKDSQPAQKIDHNTLSVYLGKHHLIFSIQGVQFRFVQKITVHPEYDTKTFNCDISVVQLQQPAEYTDWVQPACLWPENMIDLENVIGQRGTVVGWGNDGTGVLQLVEMPIVGQIICIRSKPEFYVKFTSNYTFCAGFRDGRSACNGDSGGGMVFQIGTSWYLRGLVSVSPAKNPHHPVCDPKQYVVFTDVAKFLPWIQQNIS